MSDYGDDDGTSRDDTFRDQPWFREAYTRVHTPGLILQWFGIISLVWAVASMILVMAAPDVVFKWQYDYQANMVKNQPKNQQKLPPYEDFVRTQTRVNLIVELLQMVGSFFILFGGMKMKNLESYGMSIAGSVLAILPCNCCCLLGAALGIWSLVVLFNSDVKLAFSRVRGGGVV